ncbi:MAG: secondary thiamine-phosphate synthase [Bacteroidetes bacterium HGW-Bacteroidetes-1]|jgi:secondary thiamine-phosphate synthase enzyme|nr:MAG: secondary thiamine-phosphate synthase [Bacteroidetes bacterium HGW-Bacteroidetes-1]
MVKNIPLILPPFPRGFHLITALITNKIGILPENGLLQLFLQHTSAGITINENADPTVRYDLEMYFNRLVLERDSLFTHIYEGDDDMPSHIKTALTGNCLSIPIMNRKLSLGTWQGIYLCEFRNHGGERRIIATIIS